MLIFLEIFLDQHLSANEQLSNVASKLAKNVPIMYGIRSKTPRKKPPEKIPRGISHPSKSHLG